MPFEPTTPGIDKKVTPEREAPIIPKATTYHGDCLFPLKKASLLFFLAVMNENDSSKKKYPSIIPSIVKLFISPVV